MGLLGRGKTHISFKEQNSLGSVILCKNLCYICKITWKIIVIDLRVICKKELSKYIKVRLNQEYAHKMECTSLLWSNAALL